MSFFEYQRNQNIDQRGDQKLRLSDDVLDALRIYLYAFCYPYTFDKYYVFNDFLYMLMNHVLYLMWKKYDKPLNIIFSINDVYEFTVNIEFLSKSIGSRIHEIDVNHKGDILYSYGSVDISTIEDTIKKLGSMAYGVILALIETLSNDPRCGTVCREYIDWLERHLRSIAYFPIPDVEIYESVKRMVESNGVPFESEVTIDEDIHRELKEKYAKHEYIAHPLSYENIYIYKTLYENNKHTIGQNIVSWIEPNPITNGIIIFFKLSSSDIKIYLSVNRDKPILSMSISTSFTKDAEPIADFISNWYTYLEKSLRMAIESDRVLIERGINKKVVDAYRDYLKTWLKVLERYRDEIEKNKIF